MASLDIVSQLSLALVFFLSPCLALYMPANRQRAADDIFGGLLSKDKRGTRVSWKECNLDEGTRLDCGSYGISEEGCYQRECCWGESNTPGVPWCYHSKPTMKEGCLMNTVERTECGWYGIRKHQCLAKGCCWQPDPDPKAPWCFNAIRKPVQEGECGVPATPPNVMARIVGGVEAVPHSWPWMVSLASDGEHFCGGSLINEQWVVSAAHCEPAFYWGSTREVVLGLHSQTHNDEPQVRMRIAEIISHEDYSSQGSHDHDIMLLKLEEPVQFSDAVSPVCLPAATDEFSEGLRCYTTGWGTTRFLGSSPDKLQQVMVPLMSSDTCNQRDWYDGQIDNTMICAGYMEGGRDSCQGDSGGPLVCNDGGAWTLVGVVSWGDGCASENKPGIYARVTALLNWVETTVAAHS